MQTATHDTYPTVEPTATVVPEAHWWDGKPGFHDAEVGTYSTLFGDIDGVKTSSLDGLVYDIYDTESGQHILTSQEFTSFDPYKDLQLDQARALEAEYGSAKLVVMEQADTDGYGALDKVAVRYEGNKGTLEFEDDYKQGWTVADYLSENI